MPLSFQGGTSVPTVGSDAYKVASSPNQSGSGAFNASTNSLTISSPTVMTDSNIRENTIPSVINTSNNLVGNNNSNANRTTGQQNNPENANSSDGMDYSKMSYEDIYNSAFSKVANSPVDPTTTAILKNISDMKASSDASTAVQLDAITKGYEDARQIEARANESTTGQLRGILESSGAYRTGSGSGILDAKAHSDIMALSQLSNQESSAKAAIIKAQNETNFQLMDKSNTLLQTIQDRKYKLASDIAAGITKKNEDDRTYALNVDKFNHQSAVDTITKEQEAEKIAQGKYEFRDMKDEFGNTVGTQVIDKATGRPISNISAPGGNVVPGSNGALNPVEVTAEGKPDPQQQADFLKALPPPIAANVQALIDYTGKPPNPSSNASKKLLAYAHMADPTFDESQYAIRQAYQKSLTSGTLSQAVNAGNKVINHLVSFAKSVEALNNGPVSSTANAMGTNIESGLGSMFGFNFMQKTSAQADTEANGVKDELAKFFKGTGSTDVKSIEDWGKSLDRNAPPGKLQGMVQGTLDLMSGQLNTFLQQYQSTMGKAPDISKIIQPETIAKLSLLKDRGYNVDIPGVNYTTQEAWDKYGGGTQDAWNSSVDALTKAGLPLTAENILQYAQTQ